MGVGPESSTCRCGLVGGEDPHLARRPGVLRRLLREADRLRAALDARLDAHGVAAAAHLHAQGVLLDARRQVARDGHGDRARQERSRERDLPRAAGHLELEARLDEEGDAVLDPAEDLEPQALALARGLGAGPQPEEAGLVPPRPGHALAVEAQVHEADLRRARSATRAGATRRNGRRCGGGRRRRAGAARRRGRRRERGSRRGGRPAASARRCPGGARRPRDRPAGRGRRCRRSLRDRASAGRARGRRPVPGPSRSRGSAPGRAPTGPTGAGPEAGPRARWAGRSRSKSRRRGRRRGSASGRWTARGGVARAPPWGRASRPAPDTGEGYGVFRLVLKVVGSTGGWGGCRRPGRPLAILALPQRPFRLRCTR